MANILPSHVQTWVNEAVDRGLTPRSVVKYHVVLHSISRQAVRDRIIPFNPAADIKLPKVVRRQRQILTPQEFGAILNEIPDRWGELVALGPRHIDFINQRIHVEQIALELSKRNSPTGQRIVFKDYPKEATGRPPPGRPLRSPWSGPGLAQPPERTPRRPVHVTRTARLTRRAERTRAHAAIRRRLISGEQRCADADSGHELPADGPHVHGVLGCDGDALVHKPSPAPATMPANRTYAVALFWPDGSALAADRSGRTSCCETPPS